MIAGYEEIVVPMVKDGQLPWGFRSRFRKCVSDYDQLTSSLESLSLSDRVAETGTQDV